MEKQETGGQEGMPCCPGEEAWVSGESLELKRNGLLRPDLLGWGSVIEHLAKMSKTLGSNRKVKARAAGARRCFLRGEQGLEDTEHQQ